MLCTIECLINAHLKSMSWHVVTCKMSQRQRKFHHNRQKYHHYQDSCAFFKCPGGKYRDVVFISGEATNKRLEKKREVKFYFVTFSYTKDLFQKAFIHFRNDNNNNTLVNCKITQHTHRHARTRAQKHTHQHTYIYLYLISKIHCIYEVAQIPFRW